MGKIFWNLKNSRIREIVFVLILEIMIKNDNLHKKRNFSQGKRISIYYYLLLANYELEFGELKF